MTDLATDHDSAVELIRENYWKLHKVNSNHPLLSYANTKTGDLNIDALLDKYASEEEKKTDRFKIAKIFALYAVDLSNAYKEIMGIKEEPEEKPEIDLTPIKDLDSLSDEEIPF